MNNEFAPRDTVLLPPGVDVTHPDALPVLVHLDDPATDILIDYKLEHPVTIDPDASIDEALNKLKHSGICVLLVVDTDKQLLGEVVVDDVLGEKPIRYAESSGLQHADITVSMMMQPASEVRVIEIEHMQDACVGHIIATMHSLETRYLLVLEQGSIRGLFAATQISKQLGREIMDEEVAVHSLAEMVRTLA